MSETDNTHSAPSTATPTDPSRSTRLDALRKAYRPTTLRDRVKGCVFRMILYIVVVPYLVLLFIAVFCSDSLIFQPQSRSYRDGPEILKLKDSLGATIAARYLPNANATQTILYSHGNAGDIGDFLSELNKLHDMGFAVFCYDYPGYGLSDGKPSESGAYRAIDAAYAHLTTTLHIPPEQIIIMGHSLGGGVATDLASREKVGGLILQSTFKSAFRVLTNWRILPFDKFDSLSKIGNVKCPILIIHGTRDEVIPYHHGTALFAAAPGRKQFHEVPRAMHNDVSDVGGKDYEKTIVAFAKSLK